MRRSIRTSVGVAAVLASVLAVGLLPGASRAQTPLYFPRTQTLDTTAYTLRVAGIDRYATAGALSRVAAHHQRTDTGFPFNEADATAITKSYGFGTCPKTVGIAAGDSVADALSAGSVKDLGLVAFGPTGEQVDTTGINLMLAVSARQGGFEADLPQETLTSLTDLRDACGSFDILVFGGEIAVPAKAFETLDAVGDNVVRIVGTDRFDTARQVALAVSGVKGATAVPLYTDPVEPTNLPNAVFLAEGFTGADALAVGPYLANTNVPILLTETGKLPEPTRNALIALHPQNIIVLGGPAAVSDATAIAAKRAAGIAPPPEGEDEVITRIAGEDRYQTSIAIAQQLFNVQPCCPEEIPIIAPGETVSFSNQLMAFARSEGSGGTHVGFADALSSAFFMDTANDIAVAPIRRAPPIETNTAPQNEDGTFGPKVVIGGTAGPRRAPLLLVPQGAVPEATATYLGEIFSEPGRESAPAAAASRENHGGFGFVFGGVAAVARNTELSLAQLLSGGVYTVAEDGPGKRTDLAPAMTAPQVFYTAMSYDGYTTPAGARGVSARGAFADGDKICATRGALKGAQWLAAYETGNFATAADLDYSGGTSVFQCMDATEVSSAQAQVLALSLSGHPTTPISVDWSSSSARLAVDPPLNDDRADTVTDGANLTTDYDCQDPADLLCSGGGKSSATFSGTGDIDYKGTSYTDAAWTLVLNFDRSETAGADNDTVNFTGTFTVRDGGSLLFTASVAGESANNTSPFKLAGMYTLGQGKGGMRATVTTPADDNFALTDLVLEGTA